MKYLHLFEQFNNPNFITFESLIGDEIAYIKKMYQHDITKVDFEESDFYGNESWDVYLDDLRYDIDIDPSDPVQSVIDAQVSLYEQKKWTSIRYRFEQTQKEVNNLFKTGTAKIYRSIDVNEDFFTMEHTKPLGIYWSSTTEELKSLHSNGGTHTALLVAHVPPTSVNIAHTILCRMNFATGSAEQEVRLLKGADINLLAVHQGKLHNSTYVRDLGVMIPKKRYENKIFEA